MEKKERELIEQKLSVMDSYEHEDRVYFLSLSGNVVSLQKDYYFERLHKLQDYFKDYEPLEARRLVKENLQLIAQPIPKEFKVPKIRYYHQTAFTTTIMYEGYDENDPRFGDNSSPTKRELTSMRGESLEQLKKDSWNTAKEREPSWFMEIALKVRDNLRRIMS